MRRIACLVLLAVAVAVGGCSDDDGQKVTAGDGERTTTTPAPSATTTTLTATTTPPPVATTGATTPAPTTTGPRPKATTAATTPPNMARVMFVNRYPKSVDFALNGHKVTVKANGQAGPANIEPAANGNDIVNIGVHDDPSCGAGDAYDYLEAGRSYQFVVSTGEGSGCGTQGGPVIRFEITPT